jgi:hypothetical protein
VRDRVALAAGVGPASEPAAVAAVASRVFHTIVQLLFWMNIKDTQCPAKVVRRAAVERVHSALSIADLAFDVNLLYVLKREGYRIIEVPIEWTDKLGSQVTRSFFRSSLTMFLSVVRCADLFALLRMAASVAAAGGLDLREAQGAGAAVGAGPRNVNQPATNSWSRLNPPRICSTARKAAMGSSAWRWGLARSKGHAIGQRDGGDRIGDAEPLPGDQIRDQHIGQDQRQQGTRRTREPGARRPRIPVSQRR